MHSLLTSLLLQFFRSFLFLNILLGSFLIPCRPIHLLVYVVHGPAVAGWGRSVTPQGEVYYVNHVTKSTTWSRPRWTYAEEDPNDLDDDDCELPALARQTRSTRVNTFVPRTRENVLTYLCNLTQVSIY